MVRARFGVAAASNVAAGASQAFIITLTNSSRDTLGSALVMAPNGYVVTGAAGGTASHTSASALFLGLGLRSGQTARRASYRWSRRR